MITMKRIAAIVILFLLLALLMVTPVRASPFITKPVDSIEKTLNAIDWSEIDADLAHYGYLFSKITSQQYDNIVNSLGQNWTGILRLRRLTELDNITISQEFSNRVIEALEQFRMLHYLPETIEGQFYVYYRWLLEAYRYAKEMGLEEKWNITEAFNDFVRMYNNHGKCLLFCNPETNYTGGGDRYYDENAETLGVFLKFEKLGVKDAKNYSDQIWNHILQSHWCEAYNFYSYHPYVGNLHTTTAECEVCFHTIIGEYASSRNFKITGDFQTKAIEDLQYKFLGNRWVEVKDEIDEGFLHGKYSVLWENYTCIHAEQNHEHRLDNTLIAYFVLQSYVPYMDSNSLMNFTSMLRGYDSYSSAWQGFLEESNLYDNSTGLFRFHSINPTSNLASAYGVMLMLLTNIVPVTGSLACPMNDEMYQDCSSIFPATMFRFNYAERTLRIPVFQGQLEFRLGTVPCIVNFHSTGVYELTFGEDWNTVFSVTKLSELDGRFAYLKMTTTIPEAVIIPVVMVFATLALMVVRYGKKKHNRT